MIDLCVASLAFKNFDFVAKRLPFLIECSTRDPLTWLRLLDAATDRYWILGESEGVAVYGATDHCGCIRTYRLTINHAARAQQWGRNWVVLPAIQELYSRLDTATARAVFDAWHHRTSLSTQEASALAEGRLQNTTVAHSLILTSGRGCVVCAAPAVAHASTTVGFAAADATFLQLPVCADHLEAARVEPSVLAFLAKAFSLSFDLPTLIRCESIPDTVIPTVHQLAAGELGGAVGSAEKRDRGWNLKIELPTGWHWILRLNSLMDYAYMLFKPGDAKAVYRADSAPHHPELPFFPDHEHTKPGRKKDVQTPSFLYGLPLFDLKRLRDISDQHGGR